MVVLGLTCITAQTQTPSIYFVQKGESYLSYETWLLSFSISLRPYHDHLEALETEIDYFMDSVLELTRQTNHYDMLQHANDTILKTLHEDIARFTVREVELCKLEINKLRDFHSQMADTFLAGKQTRDHVFYDLQNPNQEGRSRGKRSMLPWLGKIFSGLTGTVTEEQLERVQEHIKILADRSEVVTQVVQDTLTVVNATRADVGLNREAITHLGHIVSDIAQKLKTLYDDVILTMQHEILYDQYISRAHAAFHILQNQLRQTSTSLLQTRTQLERALYGNLAFDLIPSADLRLFLRRIGKLLPENYVLPYGVQDLKPYYQHVPVFLVSDENTVHVVVAVPIAPIDSKLTLFQPVLVPFLRVGSDLAYQYQLEADVLAISPDRYSFKLLSEAEATVCSGNGVKFCKLNHATYRTSQMKLCLTALFFKEPDQITESCVLRSFPVPTRPTIKYLFEGLWLMFSPNSESLQVMCNNVVGGRRNRPDLQIPKGVSLFTLPMSCSGRGKSYVLPAYYQNETTYEIRESFRLENMSMQSLKFLSNTTKFPTILPLFPGKEYDTYKPQVLPEIADMSDRIDSLHKRLQYDFVTWKTETKRQAFTVVISVGVVLVIIFLVCLVVILIVHRRMRQKWNRAALKLKCHALMSLLKTPASRGADKGISGPRNVGNDNSDDDYDDLSDFEDNLNLEIPAPAEELRPPKCAPRYLNVDQVTETPRRQVPVIDSRGATLTPSSPRTAKRKATDTELAILTKALRMQRPVCADSASRGSESRV